MARYVRTLYANVSFLQGRKATKIIDESPVEGTAFGEPLTEDSQALGRRAAWIHDWDDAEYQSILTYVAGLQKRIRDQITIADTLPADWRWPIPDPNA